MLKQSCFTDFISTHSFEEFEQVHAIYNQLGPKPKDSTEWDELFHAAVIVWEQSQIEPESNIELRQAME